MKTETIYCACCDKPCGEWHAEIPQTHWSPAEPGYVEGDCKIMDDEAFCADCIVRIEKDKEENV